MFPYTGVTIVLILLACSICEFDAKEHMHRQNKVVAAANFFLYKDPLPPQTGLFDSLGCILGTCELCKTKIWGLILKMRKLQFEPKEIRKMMLDECKSFPMNYCTCRGFINLNFDFLMYILNSKKNSTANDICGVIYESCGCKEGKTTNMLTIDLGSKPTPKLNRTMVKTDEKPITIVHITDIHFDEKYAPESNTKCNEPMCCRSVQGYSMTPKYRAGYWGDYSYCDLPWHTFKAALKQIKNTHKNIDYIYMTGDIVPHNIWETTIEKNTHAIKTVLKEIKKMFPTVPVFPILGNHEPSPLNVFTPPDAEIPSSTLWLYELVADEWSEWLPPETKETILKGGYYSVLARPGLRIVGINSNLCYSLNFYLLLGNRQFLLDHLNWLGQTLHQAEQAGEKVHILSHIPLNDMCLQDWRREYKRIIDRFQSTVTAQFIGHTHWDEFEIYYSLDDPKRPINVAFNGGSLTFYDFLNSNYKVFTVNPETYDVIDGETWIFNLTKANKRKLRPQWYKLYSYKEAYGMESLFPEDFDKLAHRMASDRELLKKYAWYFVKTADAARECDDNCLKDKLCRMTVEGDRSSYCEK